MSELQHIIAKGEGQELDFKFRIDDKKKIARTLAAFANTDGGLLLIGVKDNGKIKGVNPEEEYYMIEDAASRYCQPEVTFESQIWEEGHHLVLMITVDKSTMKHKALDEHDAWKYYVRHEDHTLIANKIVQRVWKLEKFGQRKPSSFDDKVLHLIKLIDEGQPTSISQLYKNSTLAMNQLDKTLSELVYWGVVEMDMSEAGTQYRIS